MQKEWVFNKSKGCDTSKKPELICKNIQSDVV